MTKEEAQELKQAIRCEIEQNPVLSAIRVVEGAGGCCLPMLR